MASPIGHTLCGFAIASNFPKQFSFKNWVYWITVLIFTNLPDFDYLFGFIAGNPNEYHRLWTHSLGFMFLSGLFVFFLQRVMQGKWGIKWPLLAMALVFSHLVVDYLGVDTRGDVGIPVFWPLISENFISPISIFRDIHKSNSSGNFIQSLFSVYNLWTIIQEILILGTVLVLILFIQKKNNLSNENKIDSI